MPVLGATTSTPGAGFVSTPYEGLKPMFAGNSYGAGNSASDNFGHFQRLRSRLNLNSATSLIAVGGQSSTNTAKTVLTTGNIQALAHPVPSDVWCLFVDALVTDHLAGGNTPSAKAVAKTRNSIAAILAGVRSTTTIADTAGSYSGTWTANSDVESPPYNTNHSTTTQGDLVTYPGLPSGGKIAVMLMGVDNADAGPDGASYSITSGGTTLATGTTGDKYAVTGLPATPRGLMPVMVTLPTGQTSLTVTKTDATGTVLYSAGAYPQCAINAGGCHVFLLKCFRYNAATTAGIAFYNAAQDQAVSDVLYGQTDPGILVYDPNIAAFNYSTMMDDVLVHPNDRGHALLADSMRDFIVANATYGIPRNLVTPS
jgi:hypothetical protein